MSYYETLGVAKDASEEDIKKAYRKLAMEHHPDRGGDEAKFKEVKQAYETLSDPVQRARYDRNGSSGFQEGVGRNATQSEIDEILRQFRDAARRHQENAVPMVRIQLDLKRAYEGAKIGLNVYGKAVSYSTRPGLPPGVNFADEVPIETDGHVKQKPVHIHFLIETGAFRFRQIGSVDGVFFSGDLETDVAVDVVDMMIGGWITIADFLGDKLQVRVPAGFDPKHFLKVAGRGYTNWRGEKAVERGDLYLRVSPKITAIKDMDPEKVKALHEATKPAA